MHVNDPDLPNPDTTEPEADADAAAMAAMDEGIAAATPAEPDPAPAADLPEGAEPSAAAAETDPAAAAEPAKADAEPERPSAEFGELPKDAKAETRERFDKMRTAYDTLHKEHAPLKAALEQAGVKDVAAFAETIPVVLQRAKDGEDLTRMVTETGASPDQFGLTLDFLGLVNKGDPESLDKAIELAQTELQALCRMRGRELPGVHDPLEDYPDLREEIESGDLTRKRALEIAQTRTADKLNTARREHEGQRQAQTEQQQRAAAEAAEAGRLALNDLGASLGQTDPHYAVKVQALLPVLAKIKAEHPPHLWAAKVAIAYAAIPNPKPAPVVHSPARPGPGVTAGLVEDFDDPMAALEAGVASASR